MTNNEIIAQLNEQKAKYEVLALAVDSAAIVEVTDSNGNIIDVNQLFCQISGYKLEELIGKNHRILKSGIHTPDFYEDMWKTILKGSVWRGEVCNKSKLGSLYWMDTTIVPILNEEGKIDQMISIRIDITARKSAESSLIHASRMASLGEMAAGIAHEINNPLTIITGKATRLSMLIDREKYDANSFKAELNVIHETAMRVGKIVNGLKSMSRAGEDDPFEKESLEKIISDVLVICQDRFKSGGVELKSQTVPNVQIKCRKVQIEQVIINLLNNSFDAILNLQDPWIAIDFITEPDQIKIFITDCGKGIPAHIAEKLMTPFFTTKAVGKGTGLGLSLSKTIIEKHAGKFWLDRQCANTRFIIELPLVRE